MFLAVFDHRAHLSCVNGGWRVGECSERPPYSPLPPTPAPPAPPHTTPLPSPTSDNFRIQQLPHDPVSFQVTGRRSSIATRKVDPPHIPGPPNVQSEPRIQSCNLRWSRWRYRPFLAGENVFVPECDPQLFAGSSQSHDPRRDSGAHALL